MQKQIEQEALLLPGETILVGVSGGTDSTALLHILCALNQHYQYGWKLHALHLNHGFRGREAREDADYVRSLCAEWGVVCHLFERDVSLYMKEKGLGAQEASREIRYALYREVAEEIGASKVALAHHADDQVETVLFRLLRGTGLHGMAGMPKRRWLVENRVEVVRPFLSIFRREIEAYCRTAGLTPREDSSNASRKYRRNRLRLDVLPHLESINPRYREHILQFTQFAQTDEKYLAEASKTALGQVILQREMNKISIAANKFQSCDLALQRRMIPLILSYLSSGTEWSSQHVEAILDMINGDHPSAELHLPDGITVSRVYNRIRFSRGQSAETTAPYWYDLVIPGTTPIREVGGAIHATVLTSPPDMSRLSVHAAVFDMDRLAGKLAVRNRRPGDRLTLFGAAGSKKVKDLLIDAKIPRTVRDRLPLLVADNEIIWVPGVRRAAHAAVNERTTRFLYVVAEYGEDWQEV
ncbi:tRNA lysidine(34) synthetase TilS [Brevibacillus sp. SYP-B805]|uniref:tRNA lysidine(34) synthetase TilS n=1 Tax=Brevibacillus sp. SYP-B805 TaxID=1578199 RepID=UPI003217AC01